MLYNIVFLSLLSIVSASSPKCTEAMFPGYPCCKSLIEDQVSDSVSCKAAQFNLAKNGMWCPTPDFVPPNDLSPQAMAPFPPGAPKGHVNFIVYRAANHGDKYATVLSNSNAADRAGVLSYIHSEVVPQDMRFQNDTALHRRKFGIDSIIVFNVTVYNPLPWLTPTIPLSAFVAFNSGACDPNKDAGCKRYETDGYQVGYQNQVNNPRATYSNNTNSSYWYSFPGGGLCDEPNATHNCTYNYRVVGRVSIDELIGLDRLGYKNYFDYDSAGNIEFSRADPSKPPLCCTTTGGVDFWDSPCDLSLNLNRIEKLMQATIRSINDTGFYNNTKDCGASGAADTGGLSVGEVVGIVAGSIVGVGAIAFIVMYLKKSKTTSENQPLLV